MCVYAYMHVKSAQCRVALCVQYLSFERISYIKTTLEKNAQTQISGGCVTRNNSNFYPQKVFN